MSADNHAGAPAEGSGLDADQVVRELYRTEYRPLVRLAVLLVDDVGTAEEIVQDSFVAMHAAWGRLRSPETALSYLRQELVRRSRAAAQPAAAHRATAERDTAERATAERATAERGARRRARRRAAPPRGGSRRAAPAPADPPEQGALLKAIRLLPNGQREALVLLLYLELPEEQAAEAMGISRRAVLQHAARGRAALQGTL